MLPPLYGAPLRRELRDEQPGVIWVQKRRADLNRRPLGYEPSVVPNSTTALQPRLPLATDRTQTKRPRSPGPKAEEAGAFTFG